MHLTNGVRCDILKMPFPGIYHTYKYGITVGKACNLLKKQGLKHNQARLAITLIYMKTGNLSKKKLSEKRQKVRRELDDWGMQLDRALLDYAAGRITAEQVKFAQDHVDRLTSEMRDLNRPVAKQIAWVGHGFKK
jgi:hypothetical protein